MIYEINIPHLSEGYDVAGDKSTLAITVWTDYKKFKFETATLVFDKDSIDEAKQLAEIILEWINDQKEDVK